MMFTRAVDAQNIFYFYLTPLVFENELPKLLKFSISLWTKKKTTLEGFVTIKKNRCYLLRSVSIAKHNSIIEEIEIGGLSGVVSASCIKRCFETTSDWSQSSITKQTSGSMPNKGRVPHSAYYFLDKHHGIPWCVCYFKISISKIVNSEIELWNCNGRRNPNLDGILKNKHWYPNIWITLIFEIVCYTVRWKFRISCCSPWVILSSHGRF